MKLLIENNDINQCLALTNENFSDSQYNIDYLSQKLHSNISLDKKLLIATRCVNLCERFHSYFHFEESFFHLLLAKNTNNQELFIEELEAAIFQDPLNYEAKDLLNKKLPIDNPRLDDHRYTSDIKEAKYSRYIEDYKNFLLFAIGDTSLITYSPTDSYWYNFEQYKIKPEVEVLRFIVNLISTNHKLYHTEAAKIYYNRYIVFDEMGSDILAKNDLMKSKNLDFNIVLEDK
jgi:hypothetical protein